MVELGSIVIFGILAQWVAWKAKLPAILPLLMIGLAVGPISTLFTDDGSKWIEPIWNGTNGLFPGDRLFSFVSLAISIILFEGSLTLKKEEVFKVGPSILKLIILGSVITFFGAGVAAHFIFSLDWSISFLFASLIIVTGPTVISPILRNIPMKKNISAILKWEGILIDPIGALIAVLVFEFILVGARGNGDINIFAEFGKTLLTGVSIGVSSAYVMYFLIKKEAIPKYLMNVFSLAAVLGVFVVSDLFAHESGLLSVVVMGMVLANINLPNIKELLHFKESLSVLLISILFILLAANINIADMLLVYNVKSLLLFLIVILILRPLVVFLSTWGSDLKTNEKLFVSWVGPRGIVAAGIASLFGLELSAQNIEGAAYITPLVFMIVLGTVFLNATTARPLAKFLNIYLKISGGVLIVGANKISRLIGSYLTKNGRHVVMLDSNKVNIEKAKKMGIYAFESNIYEDDLTQDIELSDVGFLLALTGSNEVNTFAINKYKKQFGEHGSYRLITPEEINNPKKIVKQGLVSDTADYRKFMDICVENPYVLEVEVESERHFQQLKRDMTQSNERIPILLKDLKNNYHLLTAADPIEVEKGFRLIYIGKPLKDDVLPAVQLDMPA
ncbi:MAG: sodium:proton antiporter [Flavobacteriaceae bacterium]|nr:sodium:proton antiporter [Flavobacteriaceae bacterium]